MKSNAWCFYAFNCPLGRQRQEDTYEGKTSLVFKQAYKNKEPLLWLIPVFPGCRRLRQEEHREFKVSPCVEQCDIMSQTKQNTCSFLPVSCFSDENWKTEYVPVPIPVPVYVPVPMHMYSQSIPVPTTVPVPVRESHPLILVFAGSLGWFLISSLVILVMLYLLQLL